MVFWTTIINLYIEFLCLISLGQDMLPFIDFTWPAWQHTKIHPQGINHQHCPEGTIWTCSGCRSENCGISARWCGRWATIGWCQWQLALHYRELRADLRNTCSVCCFLPSLTKLRFYLTKTMKCFVWKFCRYGVQSLDPLLLWTGGFVRYHDVLKVRSRGLKDEQR